MLILVILLFSTNAIIDSCKLPLRIVPFLVKVFLVDISDLSPIIVISIGLIFFASLTADINCSSVNICVLFPKDLVTLAS